MDSYWELRNKANQQLAESLDKTLSKAVPAVLEDMSEVVPTVRDGVSRLLKRGITYYIDDYKDTYYDTVNEDNRFSRQALKFIQLDPIKNIIKTLIDLFLENMAPNDIKKIATYLTRIGSLFSSSYVTKNAISLSIALAFHTKNSLLSFRAKRMISNVLLSLFQGYGYVEKASISAKKIKIWYPPYYHLLYVNDIEMLYFLVDEKATPVITILKAKNGKPTYQDFVDAVDLLIK